MMQNFSNHENLRFFIGDVRDEIRLKRAMEGVDVVIHAAALKQVPAAEYNPFECIKTNVFGAQNIVDAALEQGVKKVLALSTDKAAAPINLYGASKLCSDKLIIASNNIKGARDYKASVVRYGNVMGSRGSVIPFFMNRKDEDFFPITDPEMTRFNITLPQGVAFTLEMIEKMWGGEIFVPRIPSYNIMDIAKAIDPKKEVKIVGIRPGEKLHEEMITTTDSINTIECDRYFVILPSVDMWNVDDYIAKFKSEGAKRCKSSFSYNSLNNSDFLSIEALKDMIGDATRH